MKNWIWALLLAFGVIISSLITTFIKFRLFSFSPDGFIIGAIALVAILVIGFVIAMGFNSKNDAQQALGLPSGSVRAVLALTVLVLFVLVSVFFYIESEKNISLAKNILTILGTLVIAVSAFYFGVKATEQGGKIAQKAFEEGSKSLAGTKNVPLKIIQEAISNNKDNWLEKYGCKDILPGKKSAGGTQFEVNCIVFEVNPKKLPDDPNKIIPKAISYISDGDEYEIPTDVRGAVVETSTVPLASLDLIEEMISIKRHEWIEKYKVDSIIAALKIKRLNIEETPCVQFIVTKKTGIPKNAEIIPDYFDYEGYRILTDVKEEDEPTEDSAIICPGSSVHRKNTQAKGTIGLKVYKESNGIRTDYLLSCYHVFCSTELSKGITKYQSSSKDSAIITKINNSETEIANVSEGVFNHKMDASIAKIIDGVVVDQKLKGDPNTPKYGLKIITSRDVINKTNVYTYGAVSKSKSGFILARAINRKIKIHGNQIEFQNVIPVTKISVPGDSGAPVSDEFGKIIGILFASNSSTTFIIPIVEILNHFNINIYYA